MPVDIHCPACVTLGYLASRFIFAVHGEMEMVVAPVIWIEFHCKRCKSVVQWGYGSVEFKIIKTGEKNHKPQKAVFE